MVVVGAGRIGRMLKQRSDAASFPCVLVDRRRGWEAVEDPASGPVVLAVRNDDLPDAIGRVPPHRRGDLVFVQNGALRSFLEEAGLGGCTRGILYVFVPTPGAPLAGAQTSFFCGPHAAAITGWFARLGLPADAVEWPRFAVAELEKLLWLAVNGLLCEAHGATVGEVARDHGAEHDALVRELLRVGRAAWGLDPDPEWIARRLVSWSGAIAQYRASVKEWRWRNGWIRDQARRYRVATPLHDELIARTGHAG